MLIISIWFFASVSVPACVFPYSIFVMSLSSKSCIQYRRRLKFFKHEKQSLIFFALFFCVEQLVSFVKQINRCSLAAQHVEHIYYQRNFKRIVFLWFFLFCFVLVYVFRPLIYVFVGFCRPGAFPSTRLQLARELASALQSSITWRHLPLA